MKSEDIVRYVTGLEEEVERLTASYGRQVELTATARIDRDTARDEVDRLRAALPALPDVGPVTRDHGHLVVAVNIPGSNLAGFSWSPEDAPYAAAAALKACAFLDAKAAAADTTPDEVHGYCLCDSTIQPARDCGVKAHREAAREAHTTPDTSRVTFGSRHKGTGMVLLQHADAPREWWGCEDAHDAAYHGRWAQIADRYRNTRAAHAALAKVREALDTAEAAGVVIDSDGRMHVDGYPWGCAEGISAPDPNLFTGGDDPRYRPSAYLLREVQALVAQGLRGRALSDRVPYRVTDHRVHD